MTIDEAVNLLTVKYLENKAKKWIRDPVTYTLYEVWKIADSKVTYHPSESVTSNADRIRAMSNEELAELVGRTSLCEHLQVIGWCKERSVCANCLIDWFQSPAGEVEG